MWDTEGPECRELSGVTCAALAVTAEVGVDPVGVDGTSGFVSEVLSLAKP